MSEDLDPRVYVASLSDYNAGRLHGVWVDATDEPDECWAAVNRMLTTSPEPGAEEYAIHDYEGFGPLHLHEYTPLDTVWRIGAGIAAHGMAFAAWAALGDATADDLDAFEEHYAGSYPDVETYAEQYLSDLGVDPDPSTWTEIGPALAPFVQLDLTALGEALAGDAETITAGGEIHIFEP